MVAFLRRPTNYPSGIAAGGADTGFSVVTQPVFLLKRCTTSTVTFSLPAGTTLLSKVIRPDQDSPSTTGDYAIERVTGGAQTELSASAAEVPIRTAFSPMRMLTVETEFQIVPTNSPDGVTYVGFEVTLPNIRK